MTAREIAALWIIGLAGVAAIVWDHRSQTNSVLNALGAPAAPSGDGAATIIAGPSTGLTTNGATPAAGNEFGPLATWGNASDGSTSPSGLDTVFGDIFHSLSGE